MKKKLFFYAVIFFSILSVFASEIKVKNEWRNRYEFIFENENGNKLFELTLRRCYGFYDGYATVVLMNWDSAILDGEGNISERHFELLGQRFSEGKNFAKFLDLSTGVIDTKGNTLFKIQVGDLDGALAATAFYNGKAVVKQSENLWYLIDDRGNKLKEFNIFYADDFHYGFSRIQFRKGNIRTYNYIDTNGNFLSSVNFDDADNFDNNMAWVKIGEEEFFIDTNGKRLGK